MKTTPNAMTRLQRLTTEYSEAEDRIRLAGEDAQGQTVVLWLTQRLMNRLIPHLCQWLEEHSGFGTAGSSGTTATGLARHADIGQGIAQSFAQQAAAAVLPPQPPVQATDPTTQALVQSVDVSTAQEAVMLRFKVQGQKAANEQTETPAQVGMNAVALRQWLGIVYQQYLRATWPTRAWPQWMEEASRPEPPRVRTPGAMWH